MLRQTATKSTSVSCHWIRSRSRSQFLWVVGNKGKFDENGIVPVNYTSNQIIIGDIEIMTDQFFANTKRQRLDQHLFAVGYLGYKILKRLVPNKDNLAISTFIAGCWHDIGKIDPAFQDWLGKKLNKKKYEDVPDEGQHIAEGKFSWKKHPRHNEISLLLFHLLFDHKEINQDLYFRIKHAVYWHHAKPIRDNKDEIKGVVGIFSKFESLEKNYHQVTSGVIAILNSIHDMMGEYSDEISVQINSLAIPKIDAIEDKLEAEELPKYKRYSIKEVIEKYKPNIQHNALNNISRSAIITADRLISEKLTGDSLNEYIENNILDTLLDEAFQKERSLAAHIKKCLNGFNENNPDIERNRQQAIAAKKLADKEVTVGVLRGPAGCGKTKIALEWALNTHVKKIFWVCPRVQICEGLFKDLQAKEYLPDAKIEICTGEIKQTLVAGEPVETPERKEFSGDIVITTIDQIVNAITTHRNVTTLISFMDAHVVFDEYHEYINMPAFNLLFAELVECKKYQQDDKTLPNTLLVSATPNPLFIEQLLQLKNNDIIGIPSFNESHYQIDFVDYDEKNEDESNPLFQHQPPNTFVISNTAIIAQKSFIDNQDKENGILLHSKFKKADRSELFKKIYNAFKINGKKDYDILRSGPVVQAALNITCDRMISEMTNAENFLQRLGRLDRFSQNKEINRYVVPITVPIKSGKSRDRSSRFLNSLKSLQSTKAWFDYLQNELLTEKTIHINQIYELYDRFYEDANCRRLIEQDLIASLKESVCWIDKQLIDPISFPTYKKEQNKIKIKKHSLRGNNRFVQMAACKITGRSNIERTNEYAYPEGNPEESLTYGVDAICGHGISAQNLLEFMAKKHHSIKKVKKVYKDVQLLNEARDPTMPIYLSYIPDDLKKVEAKPHPYAIYYGIGKKQPIGAISIKQLNSKGE